VNDFAASLAERRVCVAGLGVSGPPVARLLAANGAAVTAVDAGDEQRLGQTAAALSKLGIRVLLGEAAAAAVPPGSDLIVTSPGWPPSAPLLDEAASAGIEIMGDVELAWRLRPHLPDGRLQRWLGVTGTNGKTTTVRMLALMLAAAGRRSIAAGNVGTSIADVVAAPDPYEVVAIELSSFQLYWSSTVAPFAAAVLNVAAHHLDWHGSFESYAAAKARIFAPGTIAIGNADDDRSAAMAAAVRRERGERTVLFRLGEPAEGELGVADGYLVDRTFGSAAGTGVRLAEVGCLHAPGRHNVADALAAAALARADGVPADAVAAGLTAFRPDPHRISFVGSVAGVDYVDDSKATNPHAAAASLASYKNVVWVAGGQLKGAVGDLDALVCAAAERLRAVVLIGQDRDKIAAALQRHAPDVPVIDVARTDTSAMDSVIDTAAGLAMPGDTVLLAPVAQSFDMFRDYGARGDAFAAAVRRLAAKA
jgi:UDP-N-acetylmuramoylalanine--D-glutamate ligase